MGAVTYTRESTHSDSTASQKQRCRTYANQNGYEIIWEFEEQRESGATVNRPQLQAMMQYCAEHGNEIDAVIFCEIDRLARSVQDYLSIKTFFSSLDINTISITEAPLHLREGILANPAQYGI